MSTSYRWRRPVLKIGTSTLTAGTTQLSLAKLADLVEQVATLRNAGLQPIVVSSGAVAAGRQRLNFPRERKNVSFKQVLAAVEARIAGLIGAALGHPGGPLAGACEQAAGFLRSWWGEPPGPPFASAE